jgi:hypothetical protein
LEVIVTLEVRGGDEEDQHYGAHDGGQSGGGGTPIFTLDTLPSPALQTASKELHVARYNTR